MKYRVEYAAQDWQPRIHPHDVPHTSVEEFQIVQHALDNGQRLYVELACTPGGSPRVLVARLMPPPTHPGKPRYSTIRFLSPDDLELIEVPGAPRL